MQTLAAVCKYVRINNRSEAACYSGRLPLRRFTKPITYEMTAYLTIALSSVDTCITVLAGTQTGDAGGELCGIF